MKLLFAGALALCFLASAAEAQTLSADVGVKSERLRLNGGGFVYGDPIAFDDATLTWQLADGVAPYVGFQSFWGKERTPDETDFNAGARAPCLWGSICRLDVSYWDVQPLDRMPGDSVDFTAEASRTYAVDWFGAASSVGWLAHVDDLVPVANPAKHSFLVWRGMLTAGGDIGSVPIQASAGYGYRTDLDRSHIPFTANARFDLGTSGFALLPGIEGFYILDPRTSTDRERRFEVAAMLTLNFKS